MGTESFNVEDYISFSVPEDEVAVSSKPQPRAPGSEMEDFLKICRVVLIRPVFWLVVSNPCKALIF